MKLLRPSMPWLGTRLPNIDQVLPVPVRDADGEERRRLYATQRWRKLRAAQLKRQPWCKQCGKQATVADHVHGHADPAWRERFFNAALLQSLCGTCHSRKTSTTEQSGAGGRRLAAPRGVGAGASARGGMRQDAGRAANQAPPHSVKEKIKWKKGPAGGDED